MPNIFDIESNLYAIFAEIEEAGGEIDDDIAIRLTINKEQLEDKLDAYAYVIKELKGEQDTLNKEIERLANKVVVKENQIARLKEVMRDALTAFGEENKAGNKSLKTLKFNYWNQNTTSVHIANEEEFIKHYIDTPWIKQKTVITIDKVAIKNVIDTVPIEGAELKTSTSIRIK